MKMDLFLKTDLFLNFTLGMIKCDCDRVAVTLEKALFHKTNNLLLLANNLLFYLPCCAFRLID